MSMNMAEDTHHLMEDDKYIFKALKNSRSN